MSTKAIEALVVAASCGSPARNKNCAHCDALAELEAIRKAAKVVIRDKHDEGSIWREVDSAYALVCSIAEEDSHGR